MTLFTLSILSLVGLSSVTWAVYLLIKWGKKVESQKVFDRGNFEKLQQSVMIEGEKQLKISISAENIENSDFDIRNKKSLKLLIDSSGEVSTEILTDPFWYSIKAIKIRIRTFISRWPWTLSQSLFIAGLLIYSLTRLIGLEDYPIFFFSDEAIQTNLASDFIRDGFENHQGEFLPTYFKNVDKFSLGLTVYAQVIPTMLFNQSVFLTRAVSVLFTILGAYWISLILRDTFKINYWWTGTLFLAISPAWFLHSRTAFEACMMASLYAGFLYYYLRYRQGEIKYLNLSLLLGALSFYSYNPGRVVISLTGLVFLLSDIKYHWKHRKTNIKSLGLLILLALPFIRFQINHPTAMTDQLWLLASYWLQPIPLSEKLGVFFSNWVFGLNPSYWFLANEHDLSRHLMGDVPHLYTITFLFVSIGLILAIKNIRKPAFRILLFALLLAPTGSAMVAIGITRAMVFIIPAILLTSLGFEEFVNWLSPKIALWSKQTKKNTVAKKPNDFQSLIIFVLLGSISISLLLNALIHGPTWEKNYGLSGMQYGAKQLFGRLNEYIEADPEIEFYVSPDWANGTQVLYTYFLEKGSPIQMGNINGYMYEVKADIFNKTFVLTPEDYKTAIESGKFRNINILEILPYPDGQPGFYFVRLEYVETISEMLEDEILKRRALVEEKIWLESEFVDIRYSPGDMGEISNLFDEDIHTVFRTLEANPLLVEMRFNEERAFEKITAVIGSANILFRVMFYVEGSDDPEVYEIIYQGSVDEPMLEMKLPTPITSDHIQVLFEDLNQNEPAHIHVWEFGFE